MTEPEKEIEKRYTYDRKQLVDFLEKVRREAEAGALTIGQERVKIPGGSMEVEYGFKIENGQSEIEIEIKWRR